MSSSSSIEGSFYHLTKINLGFLGMDYILQMAEEEGACRMNIKVKPSFLNKFDPEPQEHSVPVQSGRYDPAKLIEWVDEQTTGKWSLSCLYDTGCRPGRSFLMFSFERIESAVLLKMFHENIASEEAH